MYDLLQEINKKLDALMEHVGCKISAEEYLKMPDEKKDKYDEENIKKEEVKE